MGKQPTMGQKKSKEAIARAAAASRKGQKKKWSKGKVKEKRNYEVLVTKAMLKDMEKEIPRMRLVTIHTVSDRFKIVGSTAKRVIRHFAEQGKIEALTFQHTECPLYTGANKKPLGHVEEQDDKKKKK